MKFYLQLASLICAMFVYVSGNVVQSANTASDLYESPYYENLHYPEATAGD